MTFDIDVSFTRGEFALTAAFETRGGITALFGPSGSGKTTLAGIAAGLLRPQQGRVVLDGKSLLDTASDHFIPPHKRRIAMVFQEGRLFPHLTVRQNLAYGAYFNRVADPPWRQVLALLGIEHCLSRRPATLSGGEQRRVALGRALLAAPKMLILDEPMTGLDAARKAEIMPYLERLRDELGVPMLFISHAMDEIVRLADDLVLFEAGKVMAFGGLNEVLGRLGDDGGAVIDAVVRALDADAQLATLAFADGQIVVPAGDVVIGQKIRVHIRSREVALSIEKPSGISILNVWQAVVVGIDAAADGALDVHIAIGCGTRLISRITSRSAEALGIAPGQTVYALIKSLAFQPMRH